MPPGIHLLSSPDTRFTGMSALLTCLHPYLYKYGMGHICQMPWGHIVPGNLELKTKLVS